MEKEGASQGSTSTARKRPGSTMKLTSFFAKVPKERSLALPDGGSTSENTTTRADLNAERTHDCEDDEEADSPFCRNDIGMFVNRTDIPDDIREQVYSNVWMPPPSYKFEISVAKNGKRRTFQSHWLQRYGWLAFSHVRKGAFCKTCVLFCRKSGAGKGSHQSCRNLVTVPFTKWKDAIEIFENHARTEYHKAATVDAESFLRVARGKSSSVHIQLNQQAKGELEDNKAKLRAIVETVVLCGRQDLALRGDKDSGRLSLEEPLQNDGNFRALLRYRANGGDTILANHIRTAGNNALYSSPSIQNEIISIIGKLTQDKIVRQANEAAFFSVLADETTDVSQTEQFSLCVRYVDPTSSSIREDFLGFVPVDDVSASSLAHTLKRELLNLGLHLNMMRGQGYDGAAAMSGAFNGVQALILKDFPTALYTHCSSHSLNLCLSDASAVQDIRRAFGTISELTRATVCGRHCKEQSHDFLRSVKRPFRYQLLNDGSCSAESRAQFFVCGFTEVLSIETGGQGLPTR
ncbi:hypothetical protein HPB50_005154 [Hyalomma asiaticum]|uniref:Uncharacterized protein n=1 Tax=Hyalomma asiaticum TaxID=266040 RepID=A0ACB7S5C6_HYAAI|nr:hypothetical protein HPB50_005154 [Hyalomma asiaticum]